MSWQAVIKKWYIILLCAVLCAGGLYFEKSKVTVVIPRTSEMTYIRIVQFRPVPVSEEKQGGHEINMTNAMNSWPYLSDFGTQMEANFEMNKLSVGWDKQSDLQKIKWLGGHFRIKYLGPGLYELSMQFGKKDLKDAEYIKGNSRQLLDTYEKYLSDVSRVMVPDAEVQMAKEMQFIDETEMVKKEVIERKYAVIGAILGAVLGVVLVMVWEAWKGAKCKNEK